MRIMNEITNKSICSISAADFPYKLVFMDYSMPQMDGIETSKKIYELISKRKGKDVNSPDEINSRPCICFLSAYSDTPYIELARKIGIKHYLFKPVANEELKKMLEDVGLL